jgi:hypothetical protein
VDWTFLVDDDCSRDRNTFGLIYSCGRPRELGLITVAGLSSPIIGSSTREVLITTSQNAGSGQCPSGQK